MIDSRKQAPDDDPEEQWADDSDEADSKPAGRTVVVPLTLAEAKADTRDNASAWPDNARAPASRADAAGH